MVNIKANALFHFFAASHFAFAIWYDVTHVWPPHSDPKTRNFGDKTKFLTFLNVNLQLFYYTIALLNDIFGSNDVTPVRDSILRKSKDALFCSLAFPEAIFVSTTFWSLYGIDRELVFPKSVDSFFPWWLNHIVHTNVLICIFIELASNFRMYPPRKSGLTFLSIYMISYIVWVHIVYFLNGIWPYPILDLLNWPLRVIFHLLLMSYTIFLYVVGEQLNQVLWGKEIDKVVRSSKKKIR